MGTCTVLGPFLSRPLLFHGDLHSFRHFSVQAPAFSWGPVQISAFFCPDPFDFGPPRLEAGGRRRQGGPSDKPPAAAAGHRQPAGLAFRQPAVPYWASSLKPLSADLPSLNGAPSPIDLNCNSDPCEAVSQFSIFLLEYRWISCLF